MIYHNSPQYIGTQRIIGMDDVITSVNDFTRRVNIECRVDFQNPVHRFSYYLNISLYKSAEYDITLKYFVLFAKPVKSILYISY